MKYNKILAVGVAGALVMSTGGQVLGLNNASAKEQVEKQQDVKKDNTKNTSEVKTNKKEENKKEKEEAIKKIAQLANLSKKEKEEYTKKIQEANDNSIIENTLKEATEKSAQAEKLILEFKTEIENAKKIKDNGKKFPGAYKLLQDDIGYAEKALEKNQKIEGALTTFKAAVQAYNDSEYSPYERLQSILKEKGETIESIDETDSTVINYWEYESGRLSMADGAIVHPTKIIKTNKGYYGLFAFKSLNLMTFKGFLGKLGIENGTGEFHNSSKPQGYDPVTPISEYNVIDGFNDPVNGADTVMKGKKFPKEFLIPLKKESNEFSIQVYVPVMGLFNAGTQQARIRIHWQQYDAQKELEKLTELKKEKKESYKKEILETTFGEKIVEGRKLKVLNTPEKIKELVDKVLHKAKEQNEEIIKKEFKDFKENIINKIGYLDNLTKEQKDSFIKEVNSKVTKEDIEKIYQKAKELDKKQRKDVTPAPDITPTPEIKAGWEKDEKGTKYQKENGSFAKNEWEPVNGTWYHFDENGYMQTGWLNSGGTWYYLNADGSMAKDTWIGTYYVDASGAWVVEGWQENSYGWWYQRANGTYPHNEWEIINGTWYYFDANGYMLADEATPDGYYVDGNGAWVR